MNKIILIVLLCQSFVHGQQKQPNANNANGEGKPIAAIDNNQDYASPFVSLVLPYTYRGKIPFIGSDKKLSEQDIDGLVHDPSMLNSFNVIESSVTIVDIKSNLNGSYTLVNVTADKSNYMVIYDHIIGTTIHVSPQTDTKYNSFVGLTVRLVAIIESKKAGIKITNLFNLGVEAEKKKISGKLQVQVFGCNSQKIQAVIPVTSDLNPTSIEQALQAVATIKSLVYDTNTIVNPCVLGFVKLNNPNETIDQLKFIEAETKFTQSKK